MTIRDESSDKIPSASFRWLESRVSSTRTREPAVKAGGCVPESSEVGNLEEVREAEKQAIRRSEGRASLSEGLHFRETLLQAVFLPHLPTS